MDICTSKRMYFIRQLYRKKGKHYQRIARYLGQARIETNLITNTGPATWDLMTRIMKEIKLDFWARAFTIIKKTFYQKKTSTPWNYTSQKKRHISEQ